eukprot:2797127-Pyramimonas_sp.AAC.1
MVGSFARINVQSSNGPVEVWGAQWRPMPRVTLLVCRVPWVSWDSMALLRKAWRYYIKIRSAPLDLRVGFRVGGLLWPGLS